MTHLTARAGREIASGELRLADATGSACREVGNPVTLRPDRSISPRWEAGILRLRDDDSGGVVRYATSHSA